MKRWTRSALAMVAWWLCLCLLSGCGMSQPAGPDAESSDALPLRESAVSDTESQGEDTLYGDTDGDVEIQEPTTDEPWEIPTVTEPASTEPTGDVSETDTDTQTGYKPADTTAVTWWEPDDQTCEAGLTTAEDTSAESELLRLPPSPTLFVGNRSVEDVITYFWEVAQASEYSFGDGDANAIHKWTTAITYTITGEYTDKDMEVLRDFMAQLNQVEGFPGIRPAQGDEPVRLNILFYDGVTMQNEYGHLVGGLAADGIMTYWYNNATNEIHNGIICYRTDVSQEIRNSVILEELVNAVGLPNDTVIRQDSILYQYGSSVTELSELDWILIKILYSKWMPCGLNRMQSADVIRALCFSRAG